MVQTLVDEASGYDGEVYLFDGDSHAYNFDRPVAAGSRWLEIHDVQGSAANPRITVDGETNNTNSLQVTVNRPGAPGTSLRGNGSRTTLSPDLGHFPGRTVWPAALSVLRSPECSLRPGNRPVNEAERTDDGAQQFRAVDEPAFRPVTGRSPGHGRVVPGAVPSRCRGLQGR